MLETLSPGSQQQKTAFEAIKTNANMQMHLIGDLLDMSRIEAGKFSLSMGTHSVGEIVDNAIKSVEFAAKLKGIEIEKRVNHEFPTLVCDATRIHQVLWNLLSNAVKYTSKGGKITMEARRSDADFMFAVTDTGRGLEASDLPHVFNPLWQIDTNTEEQKAGLGLGLSISRDLVEAHGGRIVAQSEGLNRGARFEVHIPVSAVTFGEPTDQGKESKMPLQGLNILVVDDSPAAVEMIRIVLSNCGANVIPAYNGAEALELIRKNDIHFIISDISMPVMDGFSFMELARDHEAKIRRPQNRPAIALTARTRQDEIERIYKAGYQLHLIKPVQPQQLVEKVLSMLKRA